MDNGPFKTIRLRPHVLQYVICLMPSLMMCGLFFFLCRMRNFPFTELCLALSLFILCYIIFRIMYLSCMEYVITSEQLIFHHVPCGRLPAEQHARSATLRIEDDFHPFG